MPVGKLNRDIAYFQDLRDNNSLINATDFDDQFNQLVSFINDEMIPVVNTIAEGTIPGIEDSPNTFLHNIGDGSTDFVPINNDAISDFVLEFSKLAKSINSCAILAATGNDGGFIEVATNLADQLLISVIDDSPIWRKVQTGDIEDRTITGNKIGLRSLSAEHIIPGTLINNLPNNSVLGGSFADQAITNSKFIRNSLEVRNFGVIWPGGVNTAIFNNKLQRRHVMLNTLSGEKIKPPVNIGTFNLVKFITAGKLAPQVVTDAKLETLTWNLSPAEGNRFATGYFPSAALSPNFKLTNQELALNYFTKIMFEPTAEQAFTDKGC